MHSAVWNDEGNRRADNFTLRAGNFTPLRERLRRVDMKMPIRRFEFKLAKSTVSEYYYQYLIAPKNVHSMLLKCAMHL